MQRVTDPPMLEPYPAQSTHDGRLRSFLAGVVVRDRACLVIGGDREAHDKARRLVDAGATVTVVAPALTPAMEDWVRANPSHCGWRARGLEPGDLEPAPWVVVSTEPDEALSASLYERAQRERFLLCCVDQPKYCTLVNLAVVEAGDVALGMSSGGVAPGLLRRLKEDLLAGLGEPFPSFVRYVAAVRDRAPPGERRHHVADALAGFHVEVAVHLPHAWRERWRALGGG